MRRSSGAKPGSTTQSMEASGWAARMSCTTGIAWTTSPSDDSLTIRMRTGAQYPPPGAGSMGGLRDLRVRLDEAQGRHEIGFDAAQRLGRLTLEAQHQDRRRVRCPDQSEAVAVVGAHAVDRDDLLRAGKLRLGEQTLDERLGLALGTGNVEFGGAETVGQGVEHRTPVRRDAEDLEQARRRISGVVEAVPALAEEDMAAHLAGQRRAHFLHLRLDERMAGLPHQGLAAGGADEGREALCALDVVDDGGAGVAPEHVGREEHQLPVGVDDVALSRHDAEPVAVAVEGDAYLGAAALHGAD